MKEIDLNKSLFELTEEYPELISVLAGIGFAGVTNEAMRTSHGKEMTVITGCGHLGIDLEAAKATLAEAGFSVKS